MGVLSRTNGSRFMTLDPTADTVTYPSNGAGGKTTTNTSSELNGAAADAVVIDGICIFPAAGAPAAARTVQLFGHDGTTQIGMDITIPIFAATQSPYFVPLGAPGIGLRVPAQTNNANFGVKVVGTSDLKGHIVYRKVRS